MITRISQIKHSDANEISFSNRGKESSGRLSSEKAGQKERRLMKSMISDFPVEQEFFSHNYD
jgi:hypothetical protein